MQTPGIIEKDPWLKPYEDKIITRQHHAVHMEKELAGGVPLKDFANGHLFFGAQRDGDGYIFREWAPNAQKIYLIGDFSNWKEQDDYSFTATDKGIWELSLKHGIIGHMDIFHRIKKPLFIRVNGKPPENDAPSYIHDRSRRPCPGRGRARNPELINPPGKLQAPGKPADGDCRGKTVFIPPDRI